MKRSELAKAAAGIAVFIALVKLANSDEICVCVGPVCVCSRRRLPRRR